MQGAIPLLTQKRSERALVYFSPQERFGLITFYHFPPSDTVTLPSSDRTVKNFHPTIRIFRRLSRLARDLPEQYFTPTIRNILCQQATSPCTMVWARFLVNIALETQQLKETQDDRRLKHVFCRTELKEMIQKYYEVPRCVRPAILGRVLYYAVLRSAVWMKSKLSQ